MKTAYVWGSDDGFVYLFADSFTDFKHKIKNLRFIWNPDKIDDYNCSFFSDIESILMFVYDENKYEVDYWMDGQLYVLDKEKDECIDYDTFEEGNDDISSVMLDKNEMFMLNPIYRNKYLHSNNR